MTNHLAMHTAQLTLNASNCGPHFGDLDSIDWTFEHHSKVRSYVHCLQRFFPLSSLCWVKLPLFVGVGGARVDPISKGEVFLMPLALSVFIINKNLIGQKL